MVDPAGRGNSGGGYGRFHFYHLNGDWTMTTRTGRRSTLWDRLVGTGLGLMLMLGMAAGALADPSDNAIPANALVGTWRVTITTYNCVTNVQNPPIDSLLTFGDDGSLIETTSSLQFAAGQRTIGHGRWERMGSGAYRAVLEAFIMFATPSSTPPLQRGRQRVDQGITMTSRDSFTSDASVTFFNSSGTVTLSGCARASGVRFD
jgi:hypothetical protein